MNIERLYRSISLYSRNCNSLRRNSVVLAELAEGMIMWMGRNNQQPMNQCIRRFGFELAMKLVVLEQFNDSIGKSLISELNRHSNHFGRVEENWCTLLNSIFHKGDEDSALFAAVKLHANSPQDQAAILREAIDPIDGSSQFLKSIADKLEEVCTIPKDEAVQTSKSCWLLTKRAEMHLEENKEEFVADTIYRPILQDVVEVCQSHRNTKDVQTCLMQFSNLIVEQKKDELLVYFRKFIRELLEDNLRDSSFTKQAWFVVLLDFYCGTVLAFQKKHPSITVVKCEEIQDTGMLFNCARHYLLQPNIHGLPLRNFEQFMLAYSTLGSSTALLSFIPQTTSTLTFPEALKLHPSESDILSILLGDSYRNSKQVLVHYLEQSNIKLKKLPKKTVVDPLHFSLINKDFWKDANHCRILSAALMLMNDAWLLLAHNKAGVPVQVKQQYSRELLIFHYLFLLETNLNLMLEFHPIESGLLPVLFCTPSLPYLVEKCEYFLKLPWAQTILQHLPKIATNYENGFPLCVRIASNWRGRLYQEAIENVLVESLQAIKKNSKKLNRALLLKMLNSGQCDCARLAPVKSQLLKVL